MITRVQPALAKAPGVVGVLLWLVAFVAIANRSVATTSTPSEAIENSWIFPNPIVWSGTQPPAADETETLARRVTEIREKLQNTPPLRTVVTNGDAVITTFQRLSADYEPLERFIREHPVSAWVPSLRANLAQAYRERGLYSSALNHWERAWNATRGETGHGKQVADFTFAYWTRLLASLGRVETLESLFKETEGRAFDGGPLQQVVDATREGYTIMKLRPGFSYQCGTYALRHLGLTLGCTNFLAALGEQSPGVELLAVPSPSGGFSLSSLKKLAAKYEMGLSTTFRTAGSDLVVPSLVHWKQNHYAAIVAKQGDSFRVVDPTFGDPRWISRDAINAEASGYFMVAADSRPSSWRDVTDEEASSVFGKGAPNHVNDDDDQHACSMPGNNAEECSTNCTGMVRWWVSEPYTTLWLEDTPLSYQPSRGPELRFHHSFKQRNTRPESTASFATGMGWEFNWKSYVRAENFASGTVTSNSVTTPFATYDAQVFLSGGGIQRFGNTNQFGDVASQPVNYFGQTRLVPIFDGSLAFIGFDLVYVDGSKDEYRHVGYDGGSTIELHLTARLDAVGNTTSLVYGFLNRLSQVVDVDGRSTVFSYTNSLSPHRITQIIDPFARTNTLLYDYAGRLTNIIDPVGIFSRIIYDTNTGYATSLWTPYGTTFFTCNGGSNYLSSATIGRSAKIQQPDGGFHLYVYRDDSSAFMNSYHADAPSGGSPIGTLENSNMQYRNSFYWGPRQYSGLSTNVLNYLTAADYNRGRLRHWLHISGSSQQRVGSTLSMERMPSPDGFSLGQGTWYDYPGKTNSNPNYEGSTGLPGVISRYQPHGGGVAIYYKWLQRNAVGNPTNVIEAWAPTADGSILTRTNRYVYAGNGIDLIGVYAADGQRVAGFTYNGQHQITYYTNAVGEVTTNTYNGLGQSSQTKYPSGLVRTYNYFSSGTYPNWLQSIVDQPINRTVSFDYDNGMPSTFTDARGLTSYFTWDRLQRLTSVRFPDLTTYSNIYARLDLIATHDRLTNWTRYAYDLMGRVTTITNALTNITKLTWCSCSALLKVEQPAKTNTYIYDNQGRLTVMTDGDIDVSYTHDTLGRVSSTTLGGGINYRYSVNGLLIAAQNSTGQVFGATYDFRDRPIWTTNAAGIAVTNLYDNEDRLVRRELTNGVFETFTYGPTGLRTYQDPLGFVTRYARDAAGRLTYLTNANANVTAFGYSSAGELLSLTDGNQATRSWEYDIYGRLRKKFDPSVQEILRLDYDATGRLTNRWTPAFGNTAYRYNSVGDVTNVVYPAGTATNLVLRYDAMHRLTNMVDAAGKHSFRYWLGGQLEYEDGPWTNDTVNLTFLGGFREYLTLKQPSGPDWLQFHQVDALWRWQDITNNNTGVFSYHHQLAGTPAALSGMIRQLDFPNGALLTNGLDNLGRIKNYSYQGTGVKLPLGAYQYDARGLNTNASFRRWEEVYYRTYRYDGIGQLTNTYTENEFIDKSVFPLEQQSYSYDGANNLTNRFRNQLRQRFQTDSQNRLSAVTRTGTLTAAGYTTVGATTLDVNGQSAILYPDATFAAPGVPLVDGTNILTATGWDGARQAIANTEFFLPATVSYVYDGNGNLTSDGRRRFDYDPENQLIRVTLTNTAKSEFVYDGLARRRVRTEFTWTNSAWQATGEVRYIYDGGLVLQERHFDPRISTNTPQLTVTYTRGPDLSGRLQGAGGIGGLLAMTVKVGTNIPAHYYYTCDAVGNITALMDTNRAVVASYFYDPFGNLLASTGPMAGQNLYRFSSKEYHPLSGTYHYGRRYYDPNLQRWLNEDPLGESGGINLYGFVGNNPLSLIDPWGLSDDDDDLDRRLEMAANGSAFFATYAYDEETRAAHDRIMCEAGERLKNGAWDVAMAVTILTPIPGDEEALAAYLAEKATERALALARAAKLARAAEKAANKIEQSASAAKKTSQIDRKAFKAEREAYWKAEAKNNPGKYSADDLTKMKNGRAPKGEDGYSMELHHKDRTPKGGLEPMTRTDHRLGENYKRNHP